MKCNLKNSVGGICRLFRIVPVIAWSISAIALGIGMALYRNNWGNVRMSYVLLLVFIVAMFQGMASHAINDIYDWQSGTDRVSKGILSGGTSVLKNGVFAVTHLKAIGWASLALGTAGGLYLARLTGPFILVLLFIGVWSTVAYTLPPFRLAYRPLAGEWLGAWPAMAASTIGTFYVLTGSITSYAAAGAVLHATFSVAWLMQHHLPDMEADLMATPRKMTTVALVCHRWGLTRTKYVVAGYFLLLTVLGLVFGIRYNPAFFVSAFFGAACIMLAYGTNPADIRQITGRQVGMIVLSISHALSLAALFACRFF